MKTIAWDVDDVLNDLMRSWLQEEWLVTHPLCRLHYENLVENPPNRLLGIPIEEYHSSLDGFRQSRKGRELPPRADVMEWFRQYGERFRHVAVTATPLRCAHLSAAWVTRHFGPWIRSFTFVPSIRQGQEAPVYDRSKADFLGWWGRVDVLVDDSPTNVRAARDLGIDAILAPHPWNDGVRPVVQALAPLVEASE